MFQAVCSINMKIKRQVDRKIGLNGRVKTHHQKLDRILKTHFGVKGTHQNGAAIFRLANLKEWRGIEAPSERRKASG